MRKKFNILYLLTGKIGGWKLHFYGKRVKEFARLSPRCLSDIQIMLYFTECARKNKKPRFE